MIDLNSITTRIKELALEHGPQALLAIVVLIGGLWLIGALGRAMARVMRKREVDPSLIPFAGSPRPCSR